MAKRTQVILVDDLDGGDAEETVSFSVDGVSYEIDLSTKNAASLRDTFGRYVGAARRVGGRTRSRSTAGSSRRDDRSARIREWARSAGHKVSDRGRIPADLAAKFDAAH
jgi:hypothetical protein